MTNEYLKLLKQILALLGVKYVETNQVETLDLSDAVLPEFRDSYLTWVETVEANKPAKTGPVPKKSQVSMLSASTDIYVLFEFVHAVKKTAEGKRSPVLVPRAAKIVRENLYVRFLAALAKDLRAELDAELRASNLMNSLTVFRSKTSAVKNPPMPAASPGPRHSYTGYVILTPRRTAESIDVALNAFPKSASILASGLRLGDQKKKKKTPKSKTLATTPFRASDWIAVSRTKNNNWPVGLELYAARASDNAIVVRFFVEIPNVFQQYLADVKLRTLLTRLWPKL